ncbi:TetR/AcrR family transcriptional regulator [Serratia sp. M24T3]|uniref:TetR/AcrR family transcriptional regulator n=1 Tax=Serratia sp. M24T3 TaxID=932213 RepID=UPI00025BA817|nr:TetR/AcrR family transcriptional regulator [Serratia sp. M24T3]EIC82139.1 putative TetR-family transcriptional regulator [Serratia sp. M24T3]
MNEISNKKRGVSVRDAAQTQKRILAAAQTRFSLYGYDSVGTRDIAADAGVDAALINRYFGSKEKLFAAAIKGGFDVAAHLPPDLDNLGAYLVDQILKDDIEDDEEPHPFDALGMLLHQTVNPKIAMLIADSFHAEFISPLSKLLSGKDTEARAALIASYVIGLATMRHRLASKALSCKKAKQIAALAINACVEAC